MRSCFPAVASARRVVSRCRFALIGLCAVLAPLGLDARGEVPAAYPDPPEILFKDLFVAVQTSAISVPATAAACCGDAAATNSG